MGNSARELYERGVAASNAQRYAQARRLLERAAAAAGDVDLRARIAGTTAYVLAQTGDPALAEELCRTAIAEQGVADETRAVLAGQLGVLSIRAGRLDEAETELTRAIDGLTGVQRANCLLNRSLAHMHRRGFDAATADLTEAVALYAEAGDDDAAAEARHNLGYTALLRGDLVEALDLMTRSRAVIASGSAAGSAMSDLDRAEVLRDAGLVDEAEHLLADAAATLGRAGMRQARAEAEYQLARSLLRHDPSGARRTARRAARRFRALGADSWAARSDAIALDAALDAGTAPASDDFARTAAELRRLGFPSEALAVRLGGVLGAIRRGESSRTPRLPDDAPTPLRLRAAAIAAERARRASRHADARRHATDGLDLLADWQRSFGALDLQASLAMHGTGLVFAGLAAAASARDPAVLFDWSERARHTSQQAAPVRPPKDPLLAADLGELRMLRAELTGQEWTRDPRVRDLRMRVRGRQWSSTGAGDDRARIGLDALRGSLDDRTASLSYVYTGDRLLCLVATDRAVRTIELDLAGYRRAVDGLRADLDVSASLAAGPMAAVVGRALDDRMQRLDAVLLVPVRTQIGDRRLAISSPGLLGGVPWSLLPTAAGRAVTLVTSMSRWAAERTALDAPHSAGFAAGPRVARADDEVRAAASAWTEATVLTGAAAHVAAVTDLADRADVLHIAAHGRHAVDNPLFAGVELADGALFGYDVDLIPDPPATVVLSACELGRSAVRWGEEALGMTRVWLHAGTRSVIAAPSLVADDDAAALLGAVHVGLRRGDAPAEALVAASAATGVHSPFQCYGTGF